MSPPGHLLVAVEEQLAEYAALMEQAMAADLPTGQPGRWLYDLVADYPSRAGKGLRPALCLATAEAFGGRSDEALPSAVAIEMLHNAFLIHDDIEDESDLRRGLPTLHELHGVPLALNAGDALAILGFGPLQRNAELLGHRMAGTVAAEFTTMARHTLEGQAIELGWIRDGKMDLTPEDYLDLVMRKTCWYTTVHPLRIGVLVGALGAIDPDRVIDFGFHLGAAFQIRDDVLNLTGDEELYGKEILGDLLEGKRTLMLLHLFGQVGGTDRVFLADFLRRGRRDRTMEEAKAVLHLMIGHGSIEFAEEYAKLFTLRAEDSYGHAFGRAANTEAGRFVRRLITYMLERSA